MTMPETPAADDSKWQTWPEAKYTWIIRAMVNQQQYLVSVKKWRNTKGVAQ